MSDTKKLKSMMEVVDIYRDLDRIDRDWVKARLEVIDNQEVIPSESKSAQSDGQ